MATLLELIQKMGDEVGRASGVATGGTTTTLIDTNGSSPLQVEDDDELYKNAWLFCEAGFGIGPFTAAQRRISGYAPATSTITVTKALPQAPASGHAYSIFFGRPAFRDGPYKGLREVINDVLESLYQRKFTLLTMVTDGDMESATTASWAAIESATLAKITTWKTEGARSLSCECTATSGGALSNSIPVEPEVFYNITADVQLEVGDAWIEVLDETNNTVLTDKIISNKKDCVAGQFQVPEDCISVKLRLMADASGKVKWDTISMRSNSERVSTIPATVTNAKLVDGLFICGGGHTHRRNYERMPWYKIWNDLSRAEYDPILASGMHLFVQHLEPYTRLSALTDTTDANTNWVIAWALNFLYSNDLKDNKAAAFWASKSLAEHRKYAPNTQRGTLKFRRPY